MPDRSDRPARHHRPVIVVNGTPPYAAWIQATADRARMNMATLVDLALVEYARNRGLDAPPPRMGRS